MQVLEHLLFLWLLFFVFIIENLTRDPNHHINNYMIVPVCSSFHLQPISSPRVTKPSSSFGRRQPQSPPPPQQQSNTVVLGMGKGLNKARNKQAELARKLALAKQQKKEKENVDDNNNDTKDEDDNSSAVSLSSLSDDEIRQRNDRLRFEELLQNSGSIVLNDYSSDGYLNQQQEEEEITAARAGIDRIFEGDIAPIEPFEGLVSTVTQNAISKKGTKRLLPWLHGNNGKPSTGANYVIIVCDPREKSTELRQTIRTLSIELPNHIWQQLIFITGDTPTENRRFLKKGGYWDNTNDNNENQKNNNHPKLYSDESLEWMRAYTALGDKSWSMTMYVLSERRVMKLARELDRYAASKVIQNAIQSL